MAADSVPLFLNPAAGRGRAMRRLPAIRRQFEDADIAIDVRQSAAAGDLERQVRETAAAGADRIVVAGGDGSVHEAVNGMLAAGSTARLGVVPAGTGNDFAKACGIPLDWRHAAGLLAGRLAGHAPIRNIDVGRMNGRFFANGAGIGLDADVTRIARGIRWPIGDLVYLVAILRCMHSGIATPAMALSGDVAHPAQPVTLATISNGPWLGGMFHIAPMARNDDGQLDLIVAARVTRRRIVGLLPKLLRGAHVREDEISHARVRRLTVTADEPVSSHLDGEVQAPQTHFEIDVLPGTLALL